MRRTTIFLPESLGGRLKELARRARCGVSDVLRLASEDALEAAAVDDSRVLIERLRERRFRSDRRFRWNRARPPQD